MEHGESTFTLTSNIITMKASGSFNQEGALKTSQTLKEFIGKVQGESFKLLLDYSDVEGATPEAYTEINNCNIWLNSQKMLAKAIVNGSNMTTDILNIRAPARKQHNTKAFPSHKLALLWLAEQT